MMGEQVDESTNMVKYVYTPSYAAHLLYDCLG